MNNENINKIIILDVLEIKNSRRLLKYHFFNQVYGYKLLCKVFKWIAGKI